MALLQNQSAGNSATTTFSLTVTSTTAGSCGVVFLMWKSSVTALAATPITDNKSGGSQTYTQAGSTKIFGATSHYSIAAFVCPNNAAGVTQITANFATTGAPVIMWYVEESGIVTSSPLDSTATPVSATFTATPWSSGSMATSTQANLVLYGFSCVDTTASAGYAVSGSWSAVGTHTPYTADGDDSFLERQVVSATGAYAATGTTTANQTGVAYVLALKQASANLTLNLTGQTATFSAGTLTPGNSETLSGATVTSSAGTLTPANTESLSGGTITSSAGTVSPGNTQTLAGQSVTSSAGALSPGNTEGLTGQSMTSSAGSVGPGNTEALGGQTATFSPGTITAQAGGNLTLALTGITATFSAGTIAASTGAQPAGKHRKRYGVMDGQRLLIFDTAQQAKNARAIIQARDRPAPTRKIRVLAAKPLPRAREVIELGPLAQLAAYYDSLSRFDEARTRGDFEQLAVLHRQLQAREEEEIAAVLLIL